MPSTWKAKVRDRILNTRDEPTVLLIRLIVGLVVFPPEGLVQHDD